MPQLLQSLHSIVHYRLNQFHDLDAFARNRIQLSHYDLDEVTVKVAGPRDFARIAETVDKFRTSTRIADRTGHGDVCVVAYKHGALAHLRWASLTPMPLKEFGGRVVQLASDEAFTYDSYTVPAFRRQGISGEAKVFLLTYLRQQGIRCTYSFSRLDNRNTQQVWRKRIREGRVRILGVATVITRLGQMRCTFAAETVDTRPIIVRLYGVSPEQISIRSIYQFLGEKHPTELVIDQSKFT
jgi:GNAT superfamily N-acetyltransferase